MSEGSRDDIPGNFLPHYAASDSLSIFGRKEIKYELEFREAEILREEVARFLPPFEFQKGRPDTFVTTVYFDTDRLKFYNRARTSYENSLKIRVKEYYYDPGDGAALETFPNCYIEIKQRISGLVMKRRIPIPKDLLAPFLAGEEIWDRVVECYPEIIFEDSGDVYRELRRFLKLYKLHPQSIINYRRTVLQQREEDLRVTFDDHLKIHEPIPGLYTSVPSLNRITLGKPIRSINKVIMEIKCQSAYPEWLSGALNTTLPKRISKFTTSINLLSRELSRNSNLSRRNEAASDTPETTS